MGTTAPLDFLFTTFDGGGNVSPIMAVIEKLISRGHRVRVMSDEVNRDEAESAGAEFIAWHRAPSSPFATATWMRATGPRRRRSRVSARWSSSSCAASRLPMPKT